MPNRKTFDEREKYDHSAHRPSGAEAGDLAPTPAEGGTADSVGATEAGRACPSHGTSGRLKPGTDG